MSNRSGYMSFQCRLVQTAELLSAASVEMVLVYMAAPLAPIGCLAAEIAAASLLAVAACFDLETAETERVVVVE